MLIPDSKFYTNQNALYNSDFEKEIGIYFKYKKEKENEEEEEEEFENETKPNKKKIMKNKKFEKKSEDKLFLEIKTKRNINYDLKKIYNDIIIYIFSKSAFKNKQIVNLLGPLKTICKLLKMNLNLKNEYAFILYFDEVNSNVDLNKKLGLIIFDNNVKYFIDLQNNIIYKSYHELIEKFNLDEYVFAIGNKIQK